MGLAVSQVRLLTLTARKGDVETQMAIDSMEKMSLTREMTELSSEYYSKLQSKAVTYYANSQYNTMSYEYLMGNGNNWNYIFDNDVKTENSMILTDYKGQVVMSNDYANAIIKVLGSDVMNAYGVGSTFSKDKIPEILGELFSGFDAEQFQTAIDGKSQDSYTYSATNKSTLTGATTGSTTTDATDVLTNKINSIVDFYYPIFSAAASNGWTTEYNKDMSSNDDYVSDALVSGSFQLATVGDYGEYDEGTSLTYFVTAGLVQTRTDSDAREEITAWYNSEKELINEKETYIDLDIENLSTELESINTEIQSIQSFIDDAISSVFDWGSG
jgi:hypothetical protein